MPKLLEIAQSTSSYRFQCPRAYICIMINGSIWISLISCISFHACYTMFSNSLYRRNDNYGFRRFKSFFTFFNKNVLVARSRKENFSV